MVTAPAHSSADTSCWHALPLACSAFCYDIIEHVWILAVIMPVGEFRQVQWQIVLAHLVIGANDATLEQAPKAIEIGGMDISAHIFTLGMAHGFMGDAHMFQFAVSAMLVRGDQRDIFSDCLP